MYSQLLMPFTLFTKNDIASAKILPASAKGNCSDFAERSKFAAKIRKKTTLQHVFHTFFKWKGKRDEADRHKTKEQKRFERNRRRLHRIRSAFSTETARDFSENGGCLRQNRQVNTAKTEMASDYGENRKRKTLKSCVFRSPPENFGFLRWLFGNLTFLP